MRIRRVLTYASTVLLVAIAGLTGLSNPAAAAVDDYVFRYYKNTDLVMSVSGGRFGNGVGDIVWPDRYLPDASDHAGFQRWEWVARGNGWTTFIGQNEETPLALAVSGGSLADGANIIQWQWNTANLEQQWFVEWHGSYALVVNRKSGKCMAVRDGLTTQGTGLVQKSCNVNLTEQRWYLEN